MKKFLSFLVFLVLLGGIIFGAYTFVPASVTVKIFDETYIAATPKGAESLELKINNVVDKVEKEVKDVTDKVENLVKKSIENGSNGTEAIEKIIPVDTLKKVNNNGSDPYQVTDEEKQKIIDMVNNGDFEGIEKLLKN